MNGENTPELISRLVAGDRGAGDALIRRHEGALRRFIGTHLDPAFRRLVPAEDIFQETCLEALRSLPRFTYRRPLSFLFWLCGIARNRIRHHARRLNREPPLVRLAARTEESSTGIELLTTLRAPGTGAEALLDRERQVALLAAAMAQLPDRRRRALILRHVEGMSAEEAAAEMGTSPGAFRVLLSRALAELADALERLQSPH